MNPSLSHLLDTESDKQKTVGQICVQKKRGTKPGSCLFTDISLTRSRPSLGTNHLSASFAGSGGQSQSQQRKNAVSWYVANRTFYHLLYPDLKYSIRTHLV